MIKKSIAKLLSLFIIFLPIIASAAGLLPDYIVPDCKGSTCNLGHFAILIGNILKFIIGITVLGSVLAFAWAGFLYLTNLGDETKVRKAHGIFTKVAVGLIITISAWLIVSTILSLLTGEDLKTKQQKYIIE